MSELGEENVRFVSPLLLISFSHVTYTHTQEPFSTTIILSQVLQQQFDSDVSKTKEYERDLGKRVSSGNARGEQQTRTLLRKERGRRGITIRSLLQGA